MAWVLILLAAGIAGLVCAILVGRTVPWRPVQAVVWTWVTASVVVVAAGFVFPTTMRQPAPVAHMPHDQLEADRVMTQQMATVGGAGMNSIMTTNGMLARSANAAYVRALEEHTYQFDRMLGRVP